MFVLFFYYDDYILHFSYMNVVGFSLLYITVCLGFFFRGFFVLSELLF